MIHKTNQNLINHENVKIKIEPINARKIGVKINKPFSLGLDKENNIVEVLIDNYVIKIGDSFKVSIGDRSTLYTIKKITQNVSDINGYDLIMFEEFLNKSSYYILPVLDRGRSYFNIDKRLLNCYVEDNYKYLRLKYRFSTTPTFIQMDKKFKQHSLFRSTSQPSIYTIVYKFRIPIRFEKDVALLLEGKYSKISKELKQMVVNFAMPPETKGFFEMVLSKDAQLKSIMEKQLAVSIPNDVELDSKPDKQLELWPDK